jgi:hypothetical protein
MTMTSRQPPLSNALSVEKFLYALETISSIAQIVMTGTTTISYPERQFKRKI